MANIRERIIRLVAKTEGSKDLKETEKLLRNIDKQTKQANKTLKAMGKTAKATAGAFKLMVGVLAGAALGRAFGLVVEKTREHQKVLAQLDNVLKSTESAAGKTADELTKYAAELQQVTTFGDEAIIAGQALLLTFKNIQGVNFDRATRALLDVSQAMGQDLKSSAVQLGKALNDPIAGLSAMARVGITFSDSQKDMIVSMTEMGNIAGAQVLILEELESQFGGSAAAAKDTLGGAIDSLKNSFGDLFEATNDESAALVKAINDLDKAFASPEMQANIALLTQGILNLAAGMLDVVTLSGGVTKFLAEAAASLSGIAADDTVRQLERIEELNAKIADLVATGADKGIRIVQLREERDQLVALVQMNQELAKTEKEIQQARSQQAVTNPVFVPAGESEADRLIRLNDIKAMQAEADDRYFKAEQEHAKARAAATAKQAKLDEKAQAQAEENLRVKAESLELLVTSLYPAEVAQFEAVKLYTEALDKQIISQERYNQLIKEAETAYKEATTVIGEFQQVFIDGFTRNLETMLNGVLQGTQSVKEGFKDMVAVMLTELLKLAAYKGIMTLFGGTAFGSAFGGATGATPFANGAAFQGGKVTALAKGGVVSGPTIFPMANGAGLMGEAGPEAVMPLTRNSAGELGVKGGGTNVTINNMAPGVAVQPREEEGGLTIDIVLDAVANSVARGGNNVANAMESSYSLNRGRALY